jgi:hypothetical protein
MSDEDFLSYIIANSDSTRELFNGLEIARMLRLAGYGGELAGQLPLPEGRGLEEKMLTTSDQPGRKAID